MTNLNKKLLESHRAGFMSVMDMVAIFAAVEFVEKYMGPFDVQKFTEMYGTASSEHIAELLKEQNSTN